jgi:acyl carrier protein
MTAPDPGVPTRTALVSLIIDLLRDLDAFNDQPADALGPDTPLFGRQGLLDSLGLVTLVVAVEQAVEDRFGVRVALADDRAMSQTRSPYRTIGALAEYTERLLTLPR